MRYEFAPMEGITDAVFRRAHRTVFGGAARYYTPFLSPTATHRFGQRELRQVLPEENRDVPVVPQLLTKSSEDFLWAAGELAAMGYAEINWNLGCPSGTVTAKGKGAALLASPQGLDRLLGEIFARTPVAVSVKTRLGLHDPEEFPAILEILNRYPVSGVILHLRTRDDRYAGPPRREKLAPALAGCRAPLCVNGSFVSPAELWALERTYPGAAGAMAGRGAVADPALFRRAAGGPDASAQELLQWSELLAEGWRTAFQSDRNALYRMKELWNHLRRLFAGSESYLRRLNKTERLDELRLTVGEMARQCPLLPDAVWPAGETWLQG